MVKIHDDPIKKSEFTAIIKTKGYITITGKYNTFYCVARNLPDIEDIYCGIQGRREI
jgi:hypothetical protein